jgi:hypothetical protein
VQYPEGATWRCALARNTNAVLATLARTASLLRSKTG